METLRIILIAGYVVLSIYVLYLFFFRKNPYQAEYERLYNEILTSKKYKVKGQFDKE